MKLIKRRLSPVQVRSIGGALSLALIAAISLVLAGDFRTVVTLVVVTPFLVAAMIALTRRSMARGKSAEQIIDWWFKIPLVGPLFKFGDRVNSRMGRGSKELLDDSRARRGGSTSDDDEPAP